ncbi:MAG: hypothetical protein LUE14_02955 [Clostridiales bacterium]|nr:hypothetical protein [Clostridiales bacterium]
MIRIWCKENRPWVVNNLVWSVIALFCGFVFALFAHLLPVSLTQMACAEAGVGQIALAVMKAIACLSALVCTAVAVYGQGVWMAAFLKEIRRKETWTQTDV